MKTLRFFTLLSVLAAWSVAMSAPASEVTEKYADCLKKMDSVNMDDQKTGQQDWQNYCRSFAPDDNRRREATELMLHHVEAALRPDTKASVDTTVWMIRQLGIVGSTSAVPTLVKCMKSDEIRIRDEAARALANIPDDKSTEALKAIDSQLAQDALKEQGLDRDILKKTGNETAMPFAIPYASEAAVDAWMKNYDTLNDIEKARTLANIIVRRDRRYIDQALAALKSDDENLKNIAIAAVAAIGSSREIPTLLEQAFDGKTAEQAKIAISRMNDRMLDARLIERLAEEKDAGRFEAIADILKRRWNAAALPIILKRANQADCPNRLNLLRIAEELASKDKAADFTDVWNLITDRGQRDQAEQIIARLVDGDAEPVLPKRTKDNYAAMFSLLGRIGDEKSLDEIRNRVFDKPLGTGMSASPELKAAALRALFNWPDGRVIDDLLQIAENKNFSDGDRISALRAFARVASLPNERINIKIGDKEKAALLAKGMPLATRNDEKRLIIQRAGQVRHLDSLTFIMKYFDDLELRHQVCWSIIDLAHHTWLRNSDKPAFSAALDKVLETSKDQNQLNRAKSYREAMN